MPEDPLNLVLIEDDDDHFELICRHLRRECSDGVRIDRAGNLQDGVRLLSDNQRRDAVLTDLNLPDSRGLATFRQIKSVAQGTPIIALTSQSVTEDGISLMREGADDYLPKSRLDSELLYRSVMCAVERKRLSDAEIRLYEHAGQMEIARKIQMSILPESPPPWPELELAASSIPADAVGGDYYDFIGMPNGDYLIAIGDATGHGPGAALIMAMAAASLRTLTSIYTDLGEIMRRLNDLLVPETPEFAFMTFCLMRVGRRKKSLAWVNAGHPAPILIRADGTRLNLTSQENHLPAGLMPGTQFREVSTPLTDGAFVYTVTDGVTEAMNPDDELFGSDRLDELITDRQNSAPGVVLEALRSALLTWRAGRSPDDDETAVLFRWKAASRE